MIHSIEIEDIVISHLEIQTLCDNSEENSTNEVSSNVVSQQNNAAHNETNQIFSEVLQDMKYKKKRSILSS